VISSLSSYSNPNWPENFSFFNLSPFLLSLFFFDFLDALVFLPSPIEASISTAELDFANFWFALYFLFKSSISFLFNFCFFSSNSFCLFNAFSCYSNKASFDLPKAFSDALSSFFNKCSWFESWRLTLK